MALGFNCLSLPQCIRPSLVKNNSNATGSRQQETKPNPPCFESLSLSLSLRPAEHLDQSCKRLIVFYDQYQRAETASIQEKTQRKPGPSIKP